MIGVAGDACDHDPLIGSCIMSIVVYRSLDSKSGVCAICIFCVFLASLHH